MNEQTTQRQIKYQTRWFVMEMARLDHYDDDDTFEWCEKYIIYETMRKKENTTRDIFIYLIIYVNIISSIFLNFF